MELENSIKYYSKRLHFKLIFQIHKEYLLNTNSYEKTKQTTYLYYKLKTLN